MSYAIQFKPFTLRQLEKLSRDAQRRLAAKIETLRDDPFPPGCKKMRRFPLHGAFESEIIESYIRCTAGRC